MEIHYFWRLYGDGFPNPQIDYDRRFLQELIHQLTRARLYFEVFELLEYFVENHEPQLQAMASFLLAEDDFAITACVLRQAKIYSKHGKLKDAKEALSLLKEPLDEDHQMA